MLKSKGRNTQFGKLDSQTLFNGKKIIGLQTGGEIFGGHWHRHGRFLFGILYHRRRSAVLFFATWKDLLSMFVSV